MGLTQQTKPIRVRLPPTPNRPQPFQSTVFAKRADFDSTILIDDLRVGLSFASVTNALSGTLIPIPLNYRGWQ